MSEWVTPLTSVALAAGTTGWGSPCSETRGWVIARKRFEKVCLALFLFSLFAEDWRVSQINGDGCLRYPATCSNKVPWPPLVLETLCWFEKNLIGRISPSQSTAVVDCADLTLSLLSLTLKERDLGARLLPLAKSDFLCLRSSLASNGITCVGAVFSSHSWTVFEDWVLRHVFFLGEPEWDAHRHLCFCRQISALGSHVPPRASSSLAIFKKSNKKVLN